MPCPKCDEQKKKLAEAAHIRIPQEVASAIAASRLANHIEMAAGTLVNTIARGNLDLVVAILIMRRDLGKFAERIESCAVCREDITMVREFDQYMINAKMARITFSERQQRRKALGMYWDFQKSVIYGAWIWAVKPLLKEMFHTIIRTHTGERER